MRILTCAALAAAVGLAACATNGSAALTAEQVEAAGYDTIKGLADTADALCNAGTLSHDKCLTVRNDLRTAKNDLDAGTSIAALVAKITGELH